MNTKPTLFLVCFAILLAPAASAQGFSPLVEYELPEGYATPIATHVTGDVSSFTRPEGGETSERTGSGGRGAGAVWVTVDEPPSLLRFDPATEEFTPYPLPVAENSTEDSRFVQMGGGRFWGLTEDAQGNLWVADGLQGAVFRFDPATGDATRFDLGNRSATPMGLTALADGSVWIAELMAHRLARLDPATGDVTHMDPPMPNAGPLLLEFGPDGLLYVTLTYGHRVAALDPDTREWVETTAGGMRLQAASDVAFVDANTLVVTQHAPNLVTVINLTTGGWDDYAFVPGEGYPRAEPLGVAVVPGHNEVWVAVHTADRVARLNLTDGSSVEYDIPSAPFTNTVLIAVDRSGGAWFAEAVTDRLGHVPRGPGPVTAWVEPTAIVHPGERTQVRVSLTPEPAWQGPPPGALRLKAAPTTEAETFLGVAFADLTAPDGAREAELVADAAPEAEPGRYPFAACADRSGLLSCGREIVSLRPAEDGGNGTPGVPVALILGALVVLAALRRRVI